MLHLAARDAARALLELGVDLERVGAWSRPYGVGLHAVGLALERVVRTGDTGPLALLANRTSLLPALEAAELPDAVVPAVLALVDVDGRSVARPGRSATAEPSRLERGLVDVAQGPLWCAAVEARDGWLAAEALARGEPVTGCPGHSDPLRTLAGHPQVVEVMLERGAEATACALSAAVSSGVAPSVGVMLAHGADPAATCEGRRVAWQAGDPEVARTLISAGLDPFDPALGIAPRLSVSPVAEVWLEASTRFPEERARWAAFHHLRGVHYDPEAFVARLPEGWQTVPGRTLPELTADGFERAWDAVGPGGLLPARLGPGFGGEVAWPCPAPRTREEAAALLGRLRRERREREYTLWVGPGGSFMAGRDGHGRVTYGPELCPAVRPELAPVLVGPGGTRTADGLRVWVSEREVSVAWDRPDPVR